MNNNPWLDGEVLDVGVSPGEHVGIQCPACELMFIVFTVNPDNDSEVRSIPIDGTVDYFCPCCGVNLREQLGESNG